LIQVLNRTFHGDFVEDYIRYYMEYVCSFSSVFSEPCIFLDSQSRTCRIYEYRPALCRYHGVGNVEGRRGDEILHLCEKNPSGIFRKDLIDLSDLGEQIMGLSMFEVPRKQIRLFDVNYPIFLFCKLGYTGEDDY